jgi:hypothetical protein
MSRQRYFVALVQSEDTIIGLKISFKKIELTTFLGNQAL